MPDSSESLNTCSRVLGVIPVRPVFGPELLSCAKHPLSSRCVHITLPPETQALFKAAALHDTLFLYIVVITRYKGAKGFQPFECVQLQ